MTDVSHPLGQHLICIGGLPGSGKTTLGVGLACWLGGRYTVLDPDAVRLELLGRAATEAVTDGDMTPSLTNAVVDLMVSKAQLGLQHGESLIVASAFLALAMRRRFEELAPESSATFHGFWLDVSLDVLRTRLLTREALRASGVHDSTTVSAVSHRHVEKLCVDGAVTWHRIDGARQAPNVLAEVSTLIRTVPLADSSRP